MKPGHSVKSEHSVERKPTMKRERNNVPERNIPEWVLAPEQTPLSQQTMNAAANDVHIVTGWILANLGEGRLVVQCAAGNKDSFQSRQPVI